MTFKRKQLMFALVGASVGFLSIPYLIRPSQAFISNNPNTLFLILTAGILTYFLVRKMRSPPQEHCSKCSYNLTGNESGMCPECGARYLLSGRNRKLQIVGTYEIELPVVRLELVENLYALADPVYQRKAWVERKYPPRVEYDDFDMQVHFFFDDRGLADDAQGQIGWLLKSLDEATAVTAVTLAIDAVLKKHGKKRTDAEYISYPEWSYVVEAARAAISVLNEPKPPGLDYEPESKGGGN